MRSITLILLVACSGKTGDTSDTGADDAADADTDSDADSDTDSDADADTDTTEGACGAITKWDLTILGAVVGVGGGPSSGHVVLRDRGWAPGSILGETSANDAGLFELNAYQVTSTEDCWGTLLDYVIEVDREPSYYGEANVNTALYNSIIDGSLSVDLSLAPIQLEDISR